jgi:hypothetical protein
VRSMRSEALRRTSRFLNPAARSWSSSSSSVAICDDAKAKLRLLYRRVHPDLFHGDEERARVNEKSFKLLQDFVSTASRAGPEASHRASAPSHQATYELEFYVHSTDEESNTQTSKISLSLQAPSSASPMMTRRNLNKLFRAADIEELVCDDAYRDTYKGMPQSLHAFIPLVHEQYVLDLTDTSTPEMSLRTLLAAINYSRGLRVVFSKDMDHAAQSTLGKVELLRAFAEQAADKCPYELNGLTIVFGNTFGRHAAEGAILLNTSASPKSWLDFINKTDFVELHEGLEMKAAVRQLAQQAANTLGVASIHADDALSLGDPYESFLLSLLQWTPPSSRKFEGVSLVIVSHDTEDNKRGDVERGVLYVTVTDDPSTVYEHIQSFGPYAEENVRRRRHADSQMKALVSQVERTLRLRLLSKDPMLEEFRFKSACQKLLHHAAELQPILEGLKLRIGAQNAYVRGRGLVDIAWDFRV